MAWISRYFKNSPCQNSTFFGVVLLCRSAARQSIVSGFLAVSTLIALSPSGIAAETCRNEEYRNTIYTVCSFDPRVDDLRIFWRGSDGEPLRTFSALAEEIAADNGSLAFAMNGGMYQEDFSPIGLLVVSGKELRGTNTIDIDGDVVPNFYKKPNGVFYIRNGKAGILETGRYVDTKPQAAFATQSGPMLVIDGKIHPDFIEGSPSRKPRNGVGVSGSDEVHFVISRGRVNFNDFARFFRDHLGSDNALFLDGGSAPGIYAPDLGRNDLPSHGGYGPIIGVVIEKTN